MRNAKLHALFSSCETEMNQFCDIWSKQIGDQINVQYPLVESGDFEDSKIDPNKKAIMYVGRIPGKWESTEKDIIKGMEHSDRVITENFYGSSPFLYIMSTIASGINWITYEDARFCYYWTNIFRVATSDTVTSNKLKNNQEFLDAYLNSINTLHKEIEIVEPEVIIFMTGHKYDQYLKKIFSCTFQAIQTIDGCNDATYCARVISDSLPEKTFRIPHPQSLGYLGKPKKDALINTLISINK